MLSIIFLLNFIPSPFTHASNFDSQNEKCIHFLHDHSLRSQFMADERIFSNIDPHYHRRPPPVFESFFVRLFYPYLEKIPSGLSPVQEKIAQSIFDLLRNREQVFNLMQKLRLEMKSRNIEDIFNEDETKFGFKPIVVKNALSTHEWLTWVAQGYTFIDVGAKAIKLHLGSFGLKPKEGHWEHGVLSHRIQLHLVLRNANNHPLPGIIHEDYLEFYKKMGSMEFNQRLNWKQENQQDADAQTLFFHLFDSAENNASSPGFFYEYQKYWPEIAEIESEYSSYKGETDSW